MRTGQLGKPSRAGAGRLGAPFIAFSYAMLMFGWALVNPTATGNDEPSHYVKAVGLAFGQIQGQRVQWPLHLGQPHQQPWFNSLSEQFTIPPNLEARGFQVDYSLFDAPNVSYYGTYPPFVDAVPAVAIRAAVHVGIATNANDALLVGGYLTHWRQPCSSLRLCI